ncbi:MAG: hypothetical protein DME79_06910 [Verrucomicrobia bacterium]|nr:MAG: hypothetical protein DME79_06910 [Verrucomicrobiota bacterium]
MPGQISIVGFSGFICRILRQAPIRRSFFIRNQRFTLATVPNRSDSGNQESRKGISELKGKAARAASKQRGQPLFQLRKNSLCKSAVICGQQISRRGRMRTMKTFTSFITILFATLIAIPSFAQTPATSPATASGASAAQPANATGQPNPQEMMKQMMELSKLNENHKLLSSLDGNWNFAIKMWMNPDPNAPAQESKGTATRKSIMGGRYVTMDVTGKMQMPGEDGKMKDMQFKGMGLEGYDNLKKKFVASWVDNMGTGIQFSEGTYDPATKSFTYTSEMEPAPGMKMPVREVIKIADNNHMSLEWYENHGGQEKKTMEIAYTRAGKK